MASAEGAAPPDGGMRFNTVGAALDERFYQLDDIEATFVSDLTGISDPAELKKHILQVQHEVYAIHPYPCIRLFHFAKLKVSRIPIYNKLLQLGRDRPAALFLDIGSGVGNDTRKVVVDGFPANQIIASDLHPEFWDIGHKVFKSTPESFPVKFIAGDAFDDAFLVRAPVATAPPSDALDLASITSLTPLHGRLAAIHASSFFHLFGEAQQAELARRLASLLSPTPGSFIFGLHLAHPEKGLRTEFTRPNAPGVSMFCHGPASWVQLWEEVFGAGSVDVQTDLQEVVRKDVPEGTKTYIMTWSVRRL